MDQVTETPDLVSSKSFRRDPTKRAARWLEIVVLSSFALSQPLLAVIGDNATFLVAHGLSNLGLMLYAFGLIVVPAALLIAVDELLRMLSRDRSEYHGWVLRGALLALIVSPAVNSALDLAGPISLVTFALAGILGWVLFSRIPAALKLVRYASFAPIVFIAWFLMISPASGLIGQFDEAPSNLRVGDTERSVVWIIFDQLPLTLMLEPDGTLASSRFPNFAALAQESTWYPRATTVASATSLAVPASLTGRYVPHDALPVASAHPTNLFTILGNTHRINAQESVTQLCPDSLCQHHPNLLDVEMSALLSDSIVVAVRMVLPDNIADLLVPEMNDRWVGFGDLGAQEIDLTVEDEATTQEEVQQRRARGSDDRAQAVEFLDRLAKSSGPSVHYLHVEKPHEPLALLPDGRSYHPCSCYRVNDEGAWPESPEMATQRLQRYLLQAMYVDGLLGDVLETMDETTLKDEAILVVMSDHGASLLPGTRNRRIDAENVSDVLPIPLFIRTPGQESGEVDDRPVQVTDVLATVLDGMGLDPNHFDLNGFSLLSDGPGTSPLVIEGVGPVPPPGPPDPFASALPTWLEDLFPEPFNPYRWGPNHELFGTNVNGMVVGESELRTELWNLDEVSAFAETSEFAPVHLLGELFGSDESVDLAVSVNGSIAGTGTTFLGDRWQISLMLDPTAFRQGTNAIEVYEVSPDGLLGIASG